MRIVAAADIHGDCNALTMVGNMALRGNADLILLAGDICSNSRYRHFVDLLPELAEHGKCPIVFTPGNHDFWKPDPWRPKAKLAGNAVRAKNDVVCLIDESVYFDGIKIYGTPWTLRYGNWNWMKEESEMEFDIPNGTEILLSHCPPFGHCDKSNGEHLGSKNLLDAVHFTPSLKLSIFGHVHVQFGCYERDGYVDFYNVSCQDSSHCFNINGI